MKKLYGFIFLCLCAGNASGLGGTYDASADRIGFYDNRYVNVKNDSDVWDYDANGDIMPAANPAKDMWYELDSNNDIMPQEIVYMQDSNGDLMPIE